MTTREKANMEDRISTLSGLLFAVSMLSGLLYLIFTTTWLVYVFASINVLVISALIFLLVKELFRWFKA